MSSPRGERLSGSPRTSYNRAAPERVLQPTNISMSHLDQQGRRISPPASATSSTEGRASDSPHDSATASTSQRPEAVGQGLTPSQMPPQPFFKRCLAWMGSNKIATLIGVLTLLLSVGALYMTVMSYRIANNTYKLEKWRDCQDRPVRTTYSSTVGQQELTWCLEHQRRSLMRALARDEL